MHLYLYTCSTNETDMMWSIPVKKGFVISTSKDEAISIVKSRYEWEAFEYVIEVSETNLIEIWNRNL